MDLLKEATPNLCFLLTSAVIIDTMSSTWGTEVQGALAHGHTAVLRQTGLAT